MKKINLTIFAILLILLGIGCDSTSEIESEIPDSNNQISFTSVSPRPLKGNPHSNSNLLRVPDTVGVFVKKAGTFIMENAFYRITNYESNNYLSGGVVTTKGDSDPTPPGEQLFWYKTAHNAAYWDKAPGVIYDFYAYAPAVETNQTNDYYTIDDSGKVAFKIDEKKGIPVDFIYANSANHTISDAGSLHLSFRHMLSKIVFKLKNSTENAIVCYGVKYKITYPEASFNLTTGEWTFTGGSKTVEVKRYAQYEIFENSIVDLPELTTLLFPTHSSQIAGGNPAPGNVVVEFQVCLNNKWYDMTTKLKNLNLSYIEGKLIELTFDCELDYGTNDWNIFVATFDSFEEGGTIDGELK